MIPCARIVAIVAIPLLLLVSTDSFAQEKTPTTRDVEQRLKAILVATATVKFQPRNLTNSGTPASKPNSWCTNAKATSSPIPSTSATSSPARSRGSTRTCASSDAAYQHRD